MRYSIVFVLGLLGICSPVLAQETPKETVYQTFYSTRIINTQSVESLREGQGDLRIGHRFGDLAGAAGGWATFYGLEAAADVYLGMDFGLTDRLMLTGARTKGGGPVNQLLHAGAKYALLRQSVEPGMPFSLSVWGLASFASGPRSENPQALNNFSKFAHRFSYSGQLLLARKFGSFLSIQLSPGFVYRNVVPFDDQNLLLHTGVGLRLKMSKILGLIIDAQIPLDGNRLQPANEAASAYQIPLGIGLEIDADGHFFQINLTNARGMMGTDYIPYNSSNWLDGQFRLGFTISRLFNT